MDGSRSSMTVTGGKRYYEIQATYVDEGERSIRADTVAVASTSIRFDEGPRLVTPMPDTDLTYAIGDEVRVTFRGGHPDAARDRYLFAVSHLGLRLRGHPERTGVRDAVREGVRAERIDRRGPLHRCTGTRSSSGTRHASASMSGGSRSP